MKPEVIQWQPADPKAFAEFERVLGDFRREWDALVRRELYGLDKAISEARTATEFSRALSDFHEFAASARTVTTLTSQGGGLVLLFRFLDWARGGE